MPYIELSINLKLFTLRQNLDWSKLEAFAENKLNVAEITMSVFDSDKNIAGNGENAGYQHL